MTNNDRSTPTKEEPDRDRPSGQSAAQDQDGCRCKLVAKKTPLELLKVMLSDLAFWKKDK